MSELESLVEQANSWLEQDPDPETRAELKALIEGGDLNGLRERFESRIDFGTAGLRGQLGAGTNRMNRVLVSQAAAGIANYLNKQVANPSIVIGFDARKNSEIFAKDSGQIFTAQGIKVFLFDEIVATPLVAFAVRELGCSMGVMVTASHNPPGDNGYKVYEQSGSQIISPTDKEISKDIEAFARTGKVSELPRSNDFESVPESVIENYLGTLSKLIDSSSSRKPIKIVYSAMHGVGAKFIDLAFQKLGLEKAIQVASQQEPDGSFPTVAFPNPEEPGAMDHSLDTARNADADLVLVNDPDADRLAVAYKTSQGNFQTLSGDQLGLILGEVMAKRAVDSGNKGNLACSIVSSSALAKVAKHYNLGFRQTLTGFKWISRVPDLVFGYEEALGYCVSWNDVRDKDGISAAIVVADLAGRLANQGKNLGDFLDELQRRYGYFATGQISIRVQDLSVISALMQRLRKSPPAILARSKVQFTDLLLGSSELASTDGIRFDLEDGRRVIVRPSGTEAKLKCYLQAVSTSSDVAQSELRELELAMREILS